MTGEQRLISLKTLAAARLVLLVGSAAHIGFWALATSSLFNLSDPLWLRLVGVVALFVLIGLTFNQRFFSKHRIAIAFIYLQGTAAHLSYLAFHNNADPFYAISMLILIGGSMAAFMVVNASRWVAAYHLGSVALGAIIAGSVHHMHKGDSLLLIMSVITLDLLSFAYFHIRQQTLESLEEALGNLQQTQEQLVQQERLRSIGEMAAGIAHELNNPLASIVGYTDLLAHQTLSGEAKQDVEIIRRNADQASAVVKGLLDMSRPKPPSREEVDVNDRFQRVLELRGYALKHANIRIELRLAPHLPRTMADPHQLDQVILNILLNAEQAMAEAHGKGVLSVTTDTPAGLVRAVFSDDGPGVSEENFPKLFTPFFTTKSPGKGTGLGLSICQSMMTQMGGRIYAERSVSRGATFVIELPIEAAGAAPKPTG